MPIVVRPRRRPPPTPGSCWVRGSRRVYVVEVQGDNVHFVSERGTPYTLPVLTFFLRWRRAEMEPS